MKLFASTPHCSAPPTPRRGGWQALALAGLLALQGLAQAATADLTRGRQLITDGRYQDAYELLQPFEADQKTDAAFNLLMGEAALRALINQQLGYRNFNDFLHHHRLQEAAARLASEDLPILSIALDCGYGSIGPFNRAFRQRFGMTPTEYRAGSRLAQPGASG